MDTEDIHVIVLEVIAVVGGAEPCYALPCHHKISVEKASDDTNSITVFGLMAGTTGLIGRGKIISALSTFCSHDLDEGYTSTDGADAKDHLSHYS